MSKVYIHSPNKETKYIGSVIGLLIPFVLYGFYKNGIALYRRGMVQLPGMFKPLVMVALGIFISFIVIKIKKKSFVSYELLGNLLFAMIVPTTTKLWLFTLILVLLNGLYLLKRYHLSSAGALIILIILLITKNLSFNNYYDSIIKHSYSFLDYLLGKGPGGVSNSLLIMSIISLLVLSVNMRYKRQIPLMGLSIFYTLGIIMFIIKGSFNYDILLNNNVIFAFIFMAPVSIFSPYSRGGCYIYGLLLGVFVFLTTFFNVNIGVYLVILLLSFLSPLLDRIIVKKGKTVR